jgi:DNA-binding beta-propeller fold protein YncE
MNNLFFKLAIVLTLTSCAGVDKNKDTTLKVTPDENKVHLELLWESDTLLRTPESVLYDELRQVIYVSNISTGPWEKNGDGFISRLDQDGNMKDLKWVAGMDSPKGMGLVDNVLYVADLDKVFKIDVESGEVVQIISFENEDGLNDITTSADGKVYVSSTTNSLVYELVDDKASVIMKGGDERYNGLYCEDERLLVLSSKGSQLLSLSFQTNQVDTLYNNMGQGDGIEAVGDGTYITTSWKGEVFYINENQQVISLMKTEGKMNTADLDFIQDKQIVLIPTFFNNRVLAYQLKK